MRILSISSILPVPGLSQENDFVIETYTHYLKRFPGDQVVIIKPIRINLNPLSLFSKKNKMNQIRSLRSYTLNGFRVEVFPFVSAWRMRNLHALTSRTLYGINSRRLKALTEEGPIDLIHAQFILPDGMLAKRLGEKWRIPYVVTTHNERFYFDHAFSHLTAKKILLNAAAVLPINHFNFSYFQSMGIPGLCLLPIGFDQRFLKPQKTEKSGPVKILSVCSLIKLKNIDKVIQAVGLLAEKYELEYTIVGQGPERDALEHLVERTGLKDLVRFTGAVPYSHIDQEMYKHDVFIMPSFFETFGRVYFEAMAMGIPIICARNSGIYGIFRDGEEGIAVDHNSVSAISEALKCLITNPRKRLEIGRNGKKLVEAYAWGNVVETLRNIYHGKKDPITE